MLINGLLYNSEAWQGIEEKDIISFEKIDQTLLRGVLSAHPKIPTEALYLETKSLPIRFIVTSRRLMYFHTILQKNETEMVRKVYEAQKIDPSPGDFIELVRRDCENIQLNMSDTDISKLPKQRFRAIIKEKISNSAFKFLQNMKQEHSKMQKVNYEKFEMMQYLNSPLFSNNNRILLLGLRTRTIRGIRNDFRGLYPSNLCPLGCGDIDTIENLLSCRVLKQYHVSKEVTPADVKYGDIFCQNISKQQKVTELYNQLLDTRSRIIEGIPVATCTNTGPVHGPQAVQKLPILSPIDIYR